MLWSATFGDGHIFMDIDNVPIGVDFRDHLQQTLDRCDLLIAIVGPQWFGKSALHESRLMRRPIG